MITKYTSSELTTQQNKYKVISATNFALGTVQAPTRNVQTTIPVAQAGSKVFQNLSTNIFKLITPISGSGFTVTVSVWGWSVSEGYDPSVSNLKVWVPSLLAKFTALTGASSTSLGGTNMFFPVSFTLTSGFALLYPGIGAGGGMVVIDPMGSSHIEVSLNEDITKTGNIIIGGL